MEDEILLTEEEQQTVNEGEAASLLLDDPAFLLAIERIRTQCAEGILTSKPDDVQVREGLYNLSRGLTAVTEELVQMQAAAVSITENATRPTEDEQLQDDDPEQAVDY